MSERVRLFTRLAWRALVFAGVWMVLAGGNPGSWLFGLVAVAAATWASGFITIPTPRVSFPGLMRFALLFLRESLLGGVDVARRSLAPRLRIVPGFLEYQLHLPEGGARLLFVYAVSLLPGTLATRMEGDRVEIHMLDRNMDTRSGLVRLECAVARTFRLECGVAHG
jgi:multicomponent Na+:H+ antiporter subunit E